MKKKARTITGIIIFAIALTACGNSANDEATSFSSEFQNNGSEIETIQEEPAVTSVPAKNPESVELTHLNFALTFSQFEISRSGNQLIVTLHIKNTGKYEDMLDSANLVIKQGNGNAILPVLGIVGDSSMGQEELKDWKNVLNGDSTYIYAQYNIEQNQNAQYDLYYVYMDELKWLHSFSESDIKTTVLNTNEANGSEMKSENALQDVSVQLDQFTERMNRVFSTLPQLINIGGWRELEYAPQSYEIKHNQITLGVHIGDKGIDTVNVLEASNEQISEDFFEFMSSTILGTNSSASVEEISTYLSQHFNETENVKTATYSKDGYTYTLMMSNFEGLGMQTDYAYNFIIVKNKS